MRNLLYYHIILRYCINCSELFFCSFSLIPAQTSAQKLTSGDDQKKRQEVWRRYSEFEALRNFLVAVYPHIVVPPLPEKAVCVYIPSLAFLHEYQYDVMSMVLLCY